MIDPALVARVRRRIVDDGASASAPSRAALTQAVRAEAGGALGTGDVLAAVDAVRDELLGAGPLEPLLHLPGVTDVLVNGPDEVWIDRGCGLERCGVAFADAAEVRRLAVRLASSAGRRLDDAQPFVDVALDSGVRLHAVLPPICPGGPCLSLRVPRRRAFGLPELIRAGSVVAPLAVLIERLVAARMSFLVTGGTGTGKTTLLACLLGLVDAGERIVLVEDTSELRPEHPHVLRLEARPANVEGAGAIPLARLVREALRMRPDRLVVGEVRGAECVELLAALNVGHDGGSGTLHANSPTDVPARVEALCAAAGLAREATHSQLAAGLDAVIHLERAPGGGRVVSAVGVVVRRADGLVEVVPAVRARGRGVVDGPGRSALDRRLAERPAPRPGWPAPRLGHAE